MKKLAAVFTITKNENVYLPIWLEYYSRYFPMEDIYVLDHESDDGSTSNLECNVEVITNPKAFDSVWMTDNVMRMQKKLLERYEYVVYSDADELLVSLEDPTYDLYNHIRTMKKIGRNFDVGTGYEILHNPAIEDDYDPTRPILSQRRYWYRDVVYDKALIANLPMQYRPGQHECQFNVSSNPNLILLHLHKFDYRYFLQKKLHIRNYDIADPWKPGSEIQQRLQTYKDLNYFFFYYEEKVEAIPNNFPIII